MTTPDNPLLALVRALEAIRDKSVEEGGFCQSCGFSDGHDPRVRCGIAARALAAFKAWRPWEDDPAILAGLAGWDAKGYSSKRRDTMSAAIRAVFLHLGIGGE